MYPGGPQSETVRFKNKTFIALNCKNYWFLNDKSLIVSVIENWDPKNFHHDKKTVSELSSPHNGHLKKAMLSRVLYFLEKKTETSFRTFFLS